MISEPIDSSHWRLSFTEGEAVFIISVLARLGRHYQEDVAKMPPALRGYWAGRLTSGKITNKDAERDGNEMLAQAREELRMDRLALVEAWVRDFELAEDRDPWIVEISMGERDDFIAMLNDRRLEISLEMGITEAEMEMDTAEIPQEARRHAVLEIDLLGIFIMQVIGRQYNRP